MAEKQLSVLITANAKQAQKEFGALGSSAEKSGKKTTKALSGMQAGLLSLGVGAAALGAFKAFEESEKIARQTAAVIKSTGGEAQVSADHIGDLAEEMSKLGGVDDELVQQGSNMLLTFTKVRNEVGKGNDIFDQATLAANNYAAATGTDVVAANKMLGVSLNDPVKGMAKLTKAGVSFTQQQKDQVAAMVAAGDTLGAQKVILSEFTKQYGGSLEANATASGKAQVAMENLGEAAGGILAPGLELLAGVATDAAGMLEGLPRPLQQGIVGATGLGVAAVVAGPRIASMVSTISDGVSAVKNFAATSPLAQKATSSISGAVGAIGGLPAVTALGATGLGILAAGFIDSQIEAERAKSDIGDLQKMIETGFSPGEAAAKKLTNTLAGVDGGFSGLTGSSKEFRAGMDELGLSATQVAKYMTMPAAEWKKLRKEMLENPIGDSSEDIFNFVDNLELMRSRTAEAADQDRVLKQTKEELVTAGVVPASEAIGENTEKTKAATAAGGGWLASNRDLIDSFRERNIQQDKLNAGLQTAIDLTYSSIDAELALKSAHDSVQDAQIALAEARKDGSVEERQRAEDALTAAILREVQAANAAAEASATQSGKSYTAAQAAEVQRAKLAQLQTQTGFTSNEMRWLGASLDNAAREREVKIYTAASEDRLKRLASQLEQIYALSTAVNEVGGSVLSGTAGAAIQQATGKATGGDVFAGQYNLVGERGPELVRWGADGTVIPAGKTKQMLSGTSVNAGTSSFGGGINLHVTVQVAGNVTSERNLARAIAPVIFDEARRATRMGGNPLAGVSP